MSVKAAPKHNGTISNDKAAVAVGQSVDDMEPCLHSTSYAQSSEMYTHVGTVPRSQRQKKSCKGMKEKKKKKEEQREAEELSQGKSQWAAGEHVQPSPLLSAISTLSLTSTVRPLPATPAPSWASPLTPTPDTPAETRKSQEALLKSEDALGAVRSARELSNMAANCPQMTSPQDLYVPMDPISEVALGHQIERQRSVSGKQETTKSVISLQEAEDISR